MSLCLLLLYFKESDLFLHFNCIELSQSDGLLKKKIKPCFNFKTIESYYTNNCFSKFCFWNCLGSDNGFFGYKITFFVTH